MSEIPTNYLPYDGEPCNVCERDATRIVLFEDTQMALCRTCKAEGIYDREDY